jgi:hypothetical protein
MCFLFIKNKKKRMQENLLQILLVLFLVIHVLFMPISQDTRVIANVTPLRQKGTVLNNKRFLREKFKQVSNTPIPGIPSIITEDQERFVRGKRIVFQSANQEGDILFMVKPCGPVSRYVNDPYVLYNFIAIPRDQRW